MAMKIKAPTAAEWNQAVKQIGRKKFTEGTADERKRASFEAWMLVLSTRKAKA